MRLKFEESAVEDMYKKISFALNRKQFIGMSTERNDPVLNVNYLEQT